MVNKEKSPQLTDGQSYQKDSSKDQIGKVFQTSYNYPVWVTKL